MVRVPSEQEASWNYVIAGIQSNQVQKFIVDWLDLFRDMAAYNHLNLVVVPEEIRVGGLFGRKYNSYAIQDAESSKKATFRLYICPDMQRNGCVITIYGFYFFNIMGSSAKAFGEYMVSQANALLNQAFDQTIEESGSCAY